MATPSALDRAQSKGRVARLRGRAALPYILLAPTGLVLLAGVAFPWAWSLVLSFFDWSAIRPGGPKFVGLSNYLSILSSSDFLHAVGLTVILVVITVPLQMLIGFGLAYLLNADLVGRAVFQTALLVPMMVMPVMIGVAFQVLLHPVYGVLTYWFSLIGLPAVGWTTDPRVVIVTVAIMEIWRNTPMVMIVLLAGLRSLPAELVDAAKVDGATRLRFVWHIVLGWIRPFVMFSTMIMTMFELRTFDTVFALFHSGGPSQGAAVMGIYLYERFTNTWNFGISSAIAYMLLLMTMAASLWMARGAVKGVEE